MYYYSVIIFNTIINAPLECNVSDDLTNLISSFSQPQKPSASQISVSVNLPVAGINLTSTPLSDNKFVAK